MKNNKYLLLLIAMIIVVAFFVYRNAKKVMGVNTPDATDTGLDPALTARSSPDAISAMLDWFRQRPQAAGGLQGAGLIDVNPTSQFLPDTVALTQQLTSSVPADAPLAKSV